MNKCDLVARKRIKFSLRPKCAKGKSKAKSWDAGDAGDARDESYCGKTTSNMDAAAAQWIITGCNRCLT